MHKTRRSTLNPFTTIALFSLIIGCARPSADARPRNPANPPSVVCGNGVCDPSETCSSCKQDCKCSSEPTSETPPVGTGSVSGSSGETYPSVPAAKICGNSAFLSGPSSPPTGAVTVKTTDNLSELTESNPSGTTFWLTAGTHKFESSVIPKDGNIYIGAPGAIIDGGGSQKIAFMEEFYGRKAKNVTLSYLTIQNFATGGENQGAVYAGVGWKIDHSTVKNNGYVGLFAGPDNVISYNCIEGNGQLGVGTYRFDHNAYNVTIDHNEFSNNNTLDLQECGCGGAIKAWELKRGTFTNNWVHHNKAPGIWADANNIELLIEGNYINDNDGQGIFYEISYNFMIRNNTLLRNAIVYGSRKSDSFPMSAIYISESGGADVSGYLYSTSEITNNYLEDNWDGVALWQDGSRYANSQQGYLPAFADPVFWKTQNVLVHNNIFKMNKSVVGCVNNPNCGRNGLFSIWVPVPGGPDAAPNTSNSQFQVAVTFNQNNSYKNNAYYGEWSFVGFDGTLIYSRETWTNPIPDPPSSFVYYNPGNYGFNQDVGSTFNQ